MSPDRPLRAALLSMHTDPASPLGGDVTGGMNVYVREVAKALPTLGVEADVFTRAEGGGLPVISELAPGAHIIRIPAGPLESLDKNLQSEFTGAFASGIRHFANKEKRAYGILSSHYWLSAVAGKTLSESWGVPLAHRFHTIAARKNDAVPDGMGWESEERVLAENKIAGYADGLTVSSTAEAADLKEKLGAEESRIFLVPCGVDTERFKPIPQSEARAALGLSGNAKILLAAGRIEPVKGLDRLVGALAAIKKKHPGIPIRVIHIGGETIAENSAAKGLTPAAFSSPAQREEVRRILGIAHEAGVAGDFHFLGAKSQETLRAYYSAADALAVPSRYETFGLVALEAAACGLPAVAFDVGGISGNIEAGKTGYIVHDGDIIAFAESVVKIISSAEEKKRLGNMARSRAESLSWSSVAEAEIWVWGKLIRLPGFARSTASKAAGAARPPGVPT